MKGDKTFYQYMLKKHLIKCYSFKCDLIKSHLSKWKRNYASKTNSKPIANIIFNCRY